MKCSFCGDENKQGSRFCRHCGRRIDGDSSSPKTTNALVSFFQRFSTFQYVVFIAALFLFAGVAYGAVKTNDYLQVNTAIGKAQQLNQSGDFQDALSALNAVKDKAVFGSQKESLAGATQNESAFIQDENSLLQASTSIAAAHFQDAENMLASIPTNFPQYDIVKEKMLAIGRGFQTQASQAQAQAAQQAQAKAVAQAQAQASAAAAAQAQAQASAAATAQAQAEARAAASAQQAQAAQEQAQEAAAAKTAQIRQGALNALQTIYDTFHTDGISNYNEAISLYNAGDNTDAVNHMTEAMATFKATSDSITQFDNSYTNLDNDIATAALTLEYGDVDCSKAGLSFVEVINGTSDISITNSYDSTCVSDANTVSAFLNSQ